MYKTVTLELKSWQVEMLLDALFLLEDPVEHANRVLPYGQSSIEKTADILKASHGSLQEVK